MNYKRGAFDNRMEDQVSTPLRGAAAHTQKKGAKFSLPAKILEAPVGLKLGLTSV